MKTLAGRAAKSVNKFASMIKELQGKLKELSGTEIFDQIMELSGYVDDLKKKGTEEADNRLENIYELYSAIAQYQEENEDTSLQGYLTNASLASDLDNLDEGQEKVSLMTLHSAKGLEFPIVFLVGLEQGTFPHVRSLNDPLSLEEERRLCYVGITRAQEQLFISHARERYVWGSKEMKMVSQFIQEIPEELINSNLRPTARKVHRKKTVSSSANAKWSVGDRVIHHSFGEGEITHILGSGKKTNLAIQFAGLGRKIVDPRTNSITKIE